MSARILVVDDTETNVRLLQAKLEAEYYETATARNGKEALAAAVTERPDIILLDVMMPGMDGFEVCRRLKADAATRHIPVVLVTALDGRRDRINGLEAGADDFITKPIDDVALFARVRSLVRFKTTLDELRQREASGRRLGVIEGAGSRFGGGGGRIVIADDRVHQSGRMAAELGGEHRPVVEAELERAMLAARARADLLVVNLDAQAFDGLRLIARVRADETTRALPILAVFEPSERPRATKALELGASDLIARPVDQEELAARVKTLVRHKRYTDFLRHNLDHSLELAVTDPLTGLHNRRYMSGQLASLVKRATLGGDPVAALLIDVDHFKKVNDTYGHDVGDEVLREFAVRLATNVRAVDLACRFGGEEFVVIMPDTKLEDAARIAERLRVHVSGSPFHVPELAEALPVTVSIGVSTTRPEADTQEALLKRADAALYRAKAGGRNQVLSEG
ncbi:MAG: PleD family two-component system response regulator [Caulobacteraceae bacterium]|nr:PleD family two-component system response regulator [Caulobacter sp.]